MTSIELFPLVMKPRAVGVSFVSNMERGNQLIFQAARVVRPLPSAQVSPASLARNEF